MTMILDVSDGARKTGGKEEKKSLKEIVEKCTLGCKKYCNDPTFPCPVKELAE